ncbi:MAG: glycosyltransferase [Pseudomonadota bacterium]
MYANIRTASNLSQAVESGRPVRVLAAGNDLRRDWDTVARAFADDHRFEVVMLSRREHVAAYEALGKNLRFVRAGQLRSLLEWYAWADIAVIASQANMHGAGLTMLLEAAAAGIPLLCARNGGIDEYLSPDVVHYVEPQDPDALHAAALTLLSNPEMATRRAEQAKEAAQALSSAAALEQRCQVFSEMLDTRTNAAVGSEEEIAPSELADRREA